METLKQAPTMSLGYHFLLHLSSAKGKTRAWVGQNWANWPNAVQYRFWRPPVQPTRTRIILRVYDGHLTDPKPVRLPGDSTDLHPPTPQVDEEEHQKPDKPRRVQASMVKKSAATITSRCRHRNSFQLVFPSRCGAGSIPCSLRMLAIVPRATSWPRLANAPWILR